MVEDTNTGPSVDNHFYGCDKHEGRNAPDPPRPLQPDKLHENKGNGQYDGHDQQLGGFDAQVESQQVKQQTLTPFEAEEGTGKGKTMDEPEEKRKEIDQRQPRRVLDLAGPLKKVVAGRGDDRNRDQEFDQTRIDMHKTQRT